MQKTKIIQNIIPFPKMKLKIHHPDDIMAAGGIEVYSKLIGNDKPIKVPKIEFTEDEWNEMMKTLD